MASSGWVRNPVEYMRAHVPDDFFRDTLIALRDANRIAAAYCRGLGPERRVGAFAHVRREYFNEYWMRVARKHGGRARSVLNSNNSTYHLEITYKGIVFTPVAVQSPGEFPRDADYRGTLAATSQLSLLSRMGMEEDRPDPDARLYAVFAYSSDVEEESGLPVFAHVGFPHHKKRKYVDTRSLFTLIVELGKPSGDEMPAVPTPNPVPSTGGAGQQADTAFVEEQIEELPLQLIGRDTAGTARDEE